MALEAKYVNGDCDTIDYTPAAGALVAGQVVLLGNTTGLTCGVTHLDIANNTPGTLSVGGGIYDVTNLNNAANYAKVWWDDSVNKVTTTSTNMALFGYIVSGGGGGNNTTAQALHVPRA